MWYSHIWSISSVVLIGTSDVKMIIPVIKSLNKACHIHKSVWIYYLNYSMLTYLQFHFTVLLSFSSEWEDLRKTRFIVKSELIWLTWHKHGKKIWVPNKNRTHDLPSTGQVLCSLSYDNSLRARSIIWVHMWQASCILLGLALSRSSWVWYGNKDVEF